MKWLIILIAVAWFPHSLERIHSLGYDFPIYYQAGLGLHVEGWYYAEWVRAVFYPFTLIPLDAGFTVFYALLVLAWIGVARRLPILFAILSAYPMLLCLELGQITPILAWLCLFPFGSVIACAIKPYCVVFVLLHVAAYYRRENFDPVIFKTEPTLFASHLDRMEK